MVEYAEFVRKNEDPKLIASCKAIADRLAGAAPRPLLSTALPRPQAIIQDRDGKQSQRVFISYSWDSDAHKNWVREFADAVAASGIDVILDQYDLHIGEDRFQFMETSVREADAVLCVCTPPYVTKANARSSGVGVETSLITPQFYQRVSSSKQFIPVIRHSIAGESSTPNYLASLLFIDFQDDAQFAVQLEKVVRHLHKKPKFKKPAVGAVPKFQ